MSHVMIDLETMGLLPGCAILSIGACMFDPLNEDIGEPGILGQFGQFSQNIDLLSCVMAGLEVDPATAKWWREQDEEAKAALFCEKPLQIKHALTRFSAWLETVGADQLWAKGPQSDLVWLEEAYRRCGMKAPWVARQGGHGCGRDVRTIVEAAELIAGFDRSTIPEPTVAHDALADARAQVVGVQMAYAALNRRPASQIVLGQIEGDEMDRFLGKFSSESAARRVESAYQGVGADVQKARDSTS